MIATQPRHLRLGGAHIAAGVSESPHTAVYIPVPASMPIAMFSSVTSCSSPSIEVTCIVSRADPTMDPFLRLLVNDRA